MFSTISFQLAGIRWRSRPRTRSSRPSKTRSNQRIICGPRVSASGGVAAERVANTTPLRRATRRRSSPLAAGSKSAGMPPLPFTPLRNGRPTRVPSRL
jgi:hypothetical protein